MTDKISVIVPVYKVENYLHRCIDSLINQTHQNLEIILVNDGSPDKSGDICDEYALKDSRIIVIHNKNEGSSCARNAGLDVATGEFISFVDSDDSIDTIMLQTMLSAIQEHNLEAIEIPAKFSYEDKVFDDKLTIEDPVAASKRIIKNVGFAVWRRLYHKSLVEGMRFIPGIIHQDVFYTMDMLKRVKRHGYLNSTLYYYNSDGESIIRSKYSIHKITVGIRATEYISDNAIEHPEIREEINNYTANYYTDHYFLISRNTEIDPDKKFRTKLKSEIKKSLNFKNLKLRSLLVILLPTKIIELISSGYQSMKSRRS
jgi:glycosyltransferase involved in cell wall biosynthesis